MSPSGIEALASTPTGEGILVVFVAFPGPAGSLAVASVTLQLTEGVTDGFAQERTPRAQLDDLLRDLREETSVEVTPAPPGEIALLVDEAAARTRANGGAIPGDVRAAIQLLERVPRTPPPPAAPGRAVSMATLQALLERPFLESWSFEPEELVRFGVKPPPRASSAAWMGEALKAMARSPARERVIAMARYMSRWSAWRGDTGEAGEWTTLADGAERAFAECPLSMVMMTRTLVGTKTKDVSERLAPAGAPPQGLVAFAHLFPDVAARETRTIQPVGDADTYVLYEYYCVDPACDCKRVQLQVHTHPRDEFVAAIGHAFTAKVARREGMAQTFLDPMHPNAPDAGALFAFVERLLRTDTAWHKRLEDHYAMVKRSVARPVDAPPQRPKVGPNDPCPCGSGKKYKKCCRP